MTPLIYFIPNLYLSLLFTFYFSYLVIELIIKLFRIKPPLWQYLLRLIPFLKIPLVFFLFKFSNWTFANHIPLLTQPEKAKMLSINIALKMLPSYELYFHMSDHSYGFGIFDIIAEKIGFTTTLVIAFTLVSHSLIRLFFWVKNVIKEIQYKESCLIPFPLDLLSPTLRKEVQKKRTAIFISSRTGISPYVKLGKKPQIILPAQIQNDLTLEEIEATVSHELAHLHPLAHFTAPYISFIKALFFFTISKPVLQTLEKWCDTSIYKFQISKKALVHSIRKLSQKMNLETQSFLPTFIKRSIPFSRIESILTISPKISMIKTLFLGVIFIFFALFIFAGKIGHF